MPPAVEFNCAGKTTDGENYATIADMWQGELEADATDPTPSPQTWYSKSEEYWNNQNASVEGMLGGLDQLHSRDVAASKRFLGSLPELPAKRGRALDVGAGIGRVSKFLLLPLFDHVDMLEQSLAYVRESDAYLADTAQASGVGAVGRRLVCGMQEFKATGVTGRDGVLSGCLRGVYDVVWIQWCVIYLTDDHFVSFLRECVRSLAPGGVVVVKDNVARSGFLVDKDDSSIMRSDRYMRHVFDRADLSVVKHARQLDFPRSIYPVRMYALRPLTDQ